MDLAARKYRFIQELTAVEDERILEALEQVLKQEKANREGISPAHKKELDDRLESYAKNPEDLLDWQQTKNDW